MSEMFVALSGVALPDGLDEFSLSPNVTLRRTHGAFFAAYIASFAPPRAAAAQTPAGDVLQRARASEDRTTPGPWHAVNAPHMHVDFKTVLHVTNLEEPFPNQDALTIAWRHMSILRVVTGLAIFSPLATAENFERFNERPIRTDRPVLALDVRRSYAPARPTTETHLDTTRLYAQKAVHLFADSRFTTFLSLLHDAEMEDTSAGVAIRAWAAIESLYSEPGETTLKVASRVSVLLEPDPDLSRQAVLIKSSRCTADGQIYCTVEKVEQEAVAPRMSSRSPALLHCDFLMLAR